VVADNLNDRTAAVEVVGADEDEDDDDNNAGEMLMI
jgi:hypothetical protein